MKVPIWCEIVCRTCARSGLGRWTFNGKVSTRKLATDAKAAGWKLKHDECFCCNDCLKEFEKKELA